MKTDNTFNMESYYYCMFLLLFSFMVVPTSSQLATGDCNAFEVGTNNFYKITQLRQFPGQEPLWVRIQDGKMYYNLNGATFKIESNQKDDVAVHGINWARKTWEIEDASQNRLSRNWTNAYLFLKRANRLFEIKFNDSDPYNFYEDYSAVFEPHAQVAFMLKKTNSQKGNLFWLALKRLTREKGAVVAQRVAFFDGTVISMDIDGNANKIILAAKKNNIGIVYILQHLNNHPCPFNIGSVALKFVQSSYDAFKNAVLKNGALKCENYRRELTELQESERTAACKMLSDYENNLNANGIRSITALIEEEKILRERLNKQSALLQSANTKLHKLLGTAVLNKRTYTPGANSVFSEKLMTTEIDEYLAHNYVCVLKDELDKGEKALDIGTQMSYLKEALLMVEEDLEEISSQT